MADDYNAEIDIVLEDRIHTSFHRCTVWIQTNILVKMVEQTLEPRKL
jgi:hypothetical protein